MSESSAYRAGPGTGLIDPCPGEPALVLDALVAATAAAAHEELEPWRLTDRRLITELAAAQVRATRAHARWLGRRWGAARCPSSRHG